MFAGTFATGTFGGALGGLFAGAFATGALPGRFVGTVCGGWLAGCLELPTAGGLTGRLVLSVAGLPGGACLTKGCAAAAFAGRKLCTSWTANGWPGCFASSCCCLANGTGGGGGVVFATTGRLTTASGGRATRLAVGADVPRTLSRLGATTALDTTGAAAICFSFTGTAALATGAELRNAFCGTAVTAPGTARFT